MTTVKIDIAQIRSAISAAEGLAERIDGQRARASYSTPIALPSLEDGSLDKISRWLTDNLDDLTTRRDLAILLDDEGTGTASYTVPADTITNVKQLLGEQLADDLDDIDDIRSPEELAKMQAAVKLLMEYSDDATVAGSVANTLGPDKLGDLIEQAAAMTGPYSNYPSTYASYEGTTYSDEYAKVVALQDDLAEALSASLASASRAGKLTPDYGRELVENNGPLVPAVIFDYGHRGGHTFSADFLQDAGDALLEWENGQGGMYWAGFPDDGLNYGTSDHSELRDPTVQWMEALSDNTTAAQQVLLDVDKAGYLLERFSPSEETSGNAAGMVLQTATIDQAMSNSAYYGQNAATISSWAIDHFGGGAKAQDGVNEELGGIVATYIRDVDRISTYTGANPGAGTYGPGDVPATALQGDGFPPYGIILDRDKLSNLLGDIGDNDKAVELIGGASSRLNEIRTQIAIGDIQADVAAGNLNLSDPIGTDNPAYSAAAKNAAFTGFLYDGLLEGDMADAKADAEQRKRLAGLLLLPTEYVKVPGGPVGSYVVGQVKEQITQAIVGNGVSESLDNSNTMFNDIQSQTQLQTMRSLLTSDANLPMGDLASVWPTDSHGVPLQIDELSINDKIDIFNTASTGGNGYASSAYNGAADATDRLIDQYGGS